MNGMMDSDHRNHKSTQTILDGAFTIQETNDKRALVFSHSKDATRAWDAYSGDNHHGATGQLGTFEDSLAEITEALTEALTEYNS